MLAGPDGAFPSAWSLAGSVGVADARCGSGGTADIALFVHQVPAGITQTKHPASDIGQGNCRRMRVPKHVRGLQGVSADFQRAIDLAETKQHDAQRGFGVHLSALSKLERRGGVALGHVQLQGKLELFFCCERIALSVQDGAEHPVSDHPA